MIEPFLPLVREMIDQHNLSAVRIYEELRKKSFQGSYSLVKQYSRPMRNDRKILVVYRYETDPGKQSQVDFSEFGYIEIREALPRRNMNSPCTDISEPWTLYHFPWSWGRCRSSPHSLSGTAGTLDSWSWWDRFPWAPCPSWECCWPGREEKNPLRHNRQEMWKPSWTQCREPSSVACNRISTSYFMISIVPCISWKNQLNLDNVISLVIPA